MPKERAYISCLATDNSHLALPATSMPIPRVRCCLGATVTEFDAPLTPFRLSCWVLNTPERYCRMLAQKVLLAIHSISITAVIALLPRPYSSLSGFQTISCYSAGGRCLGRLWREDHCVAQCGV